MAGNKGGDRRPHILSATKADLEAFAVASNAHRGHGRRVFTAVHKKRLPLAQIPGIPERLRRQLEEAFATSPPRVVRRQVSTDGTRKLLFGDDPLHTFESVFIPGVDRGRAANTLCVSSQTGCALGCAFCVTATRQRPHNLAPEQIVGQVHAVQSELASQGQGQQVTNIVFMGMGEPLLNYEAVTRTCRILLDHEGLDFSRRRITISTAGIVPRIADLGRDLRVHLAVSVNATTDAVRNRLMPVNRRWPLSQLIAAMRDYPLPRRQRMTVEYLLLDGINDSRDDARRLVELMRDIAVKVNLLPLNAHPHTNLRPSPPARVRRFQETLWDGGLSAIVRTPRGRDIAAACGQLGTDSAAVLSGT